MEFAVGTLNWLIAPTKALKPRDGRKTSLRAIYSPRIFVLNPIKLIFFSISSTTLTWPGVKNFNWLRSAGRSSCARSEEHTSELQSQFHLVCRLLLEKKEE